MIKRERSLIPSVKNVILINLKNNRCFSLVVSKLVSVVGEGVVVIGVLMLYGRKIPRTRNPENRGYFTHKNLVFF